MINQGYVDSITLYRLDQRTLFVFVAMQVPQVNAKQRVIEPRYLDSITL